MIYNSRLGVDLGLDVAREHDLLPTEPEDLPTGPGKRVAALRCTGALVVGEMLPYHPFDGGERVRDDNGDVWFVESATVQPCGVEEASRA